MKGIHGNLLQKLKLKFDLSSLSRTRFPTNDKDIFLLQQLQYITFQRRNWKSSPSFRHVLKGNKYICN